MITTLIAAVMAAAQPVPAAGPAQQQAPSQPMPHEHDQKGQMSPEDCAKCCDEMMADMHAGHHSAPSEHRHQ